MQSPAGAAPAPARPRLRPIALPTEHGGWPLLLEPILLGLLVAPTQAGLLIGLAALGAFLLRHPAQLALADLRRGKRFPRTPWALGFAALYGLAVLGCGAAALLRAGPLVWPALAIALPLAAVQLAYDLRRRSRELPAELAGALALAGTTPALLLAGGFGLPQALALWGLLAARAAPAILYVRARLRRARGEPASAAAPLAAHALGLALAAPLALAHLAPWTGVLALGLLLARAVWGLAPGRQTVRAAVVGAQETVFGLLAVLLIAFGSTR